MARTNISVDQKVFDEFSTQADRQHKTLFAFANESLSAVAKVAAEGGNPAELYALWRSTTLLKQIDVVALPSDFVDQLITRLFADDKAGTLKLFRDMGAQLSGVLKIAAADLPALAQLAKDLGGLLPIKQLTIKEQERGSMEIDVVGAGRKLESTECAFEFLEAVVNGYGYSVTKKEVNVGTLRLWISSRGFR